MDVTGTVIQTDVQKGSSKISGKEWQCKNFVVEYMEGTYQKHLAFELFGDRLIEENPFRKGQTVTVSFDIESTEWNGRWYTKCRAYRVRKFDPKATPEPTLQTQTVGTPMIPLSDNEALPF